MANLVGITVRTPRPRLGEFDESSISLRGHEAQELTRRLIDMGFGPKPERKPEKPKGVGDVSELEYLRSLVFELSKK